MGDQDTPKPQDESGKEPRIGFKCACGVILETRRQFNTHLVMMGKQDGKGKHYGAGRVDLDTGELVTPSPKMEPATQEITAAGDALPLESEEPDSDSRPDEGNKPSSGKPGRPRGTKGKTESEGKGKSVAVGQILIVSEDWLLSQEGGLLVLDTYKKAKQDIGYTGKVGTFIEDVFRFYRKVMNYKEDTNGGPVDEPISASSGGGDGPA